MFRSILVILMSLFLSTSQASVDPIQRYVELLEQKPRVVTWILKTYPKNVRTIKEGELIANHLIFNAAAQDISLDILIGLVSTESSFIKTAISHEGAKGLMQVLPKYHRDKIKGRNLFDPAVGVEVGTRVLKDCLIKAKYNTVRALSCYSGYSIKGVKKYHHKVMSQAASFRLDNLTEAIPPVLVALARTD